MNVVCPICHRTHPPGALFCSQDGVPLDPQQPDEPLNAGTAPFPTAFVFPDGPCCANFNQLATASQRQWSASCDLLARGAFQAFFEGIGRLDLAEAARSAAQEPDRDRGLSQLLERLPADTLQPPKLAIEPMKISLSGLTPGKDDTFDLVAVNQGMLLLTGVMTCRCDWLAFDEAGRQTQKVFQTTGEICIPVRVVGNKLRAGQKPLEAEIVIESNGGNVAVPVRAEIPIRPFPTGVLAGATTPRDLAAQANAHPKEAAVLFDDGAVLAWYQDNGWTYPIQGQAASGLGALQQFYEVLGLVKPPRLSLDAERLQFVGKPGEHLSGKVHVSTQEDAAVFAHAESDQSWLTVGQVKPRGSKITIAFDIIVPPMPTETQQARLTIVGNGQQRLLVTIELKAPSHAPLTPSHSEPPIGKPAYPIGAPAPLAVQLAPISVPAEPAPIVSSSGRRLTTLVREAVETAVSQTAPVARKGINELSVLSLTLGMIGLAITWPFGLGRFGIALGVGGMVASAIALALLAIRKRNDYTFPTLAGLINSQALVMALLLTWYPPRPPEAPPAKPNFPAIAELRDALNSSDIERRTSAVGAIGELAANLEATRVDLLVALQDHEEKVRLAALDSLGQLGAPARVTYPVILHLAKTDASDEVRKHAERILKKLNPPNRADVPEFLVALKDVNAKLRSSAALALGEIGPEAGDAVVRSLTKTLGDPDLGVRVSAAQALWEVSADQAKEAVPVLIAGLQDQARSELRSRAANVLGAMKSEDAKALDALEAALKDEEGGVRIEAAFALGSIGAQRSMPKFFEALEDREVKVRLVAAQALWLLADETKGLPVLIAALGHRDADVRVTAAVTLGKFGPKASEAVPELSKALTDYDAGVRARAAEAIHHIGPEAHGAVPALRVALISSDASLRSQAAYALSGLGVEARDAMPELQKALDDQDAGVRLFAARAYWAVDPKLDVVLPVMTRILKEDKKDSADQRARAAATLGSLGSRASSVIPELHEALHDPDSKVRMASAKAIADIGGPQAKVTYPTLSELAKDEKSEDSVRTAAADALKKIGRPTKADIDTLIQALENKHDRFRASAAVNLWLMNRDAKKAVPALSKRLADKNELVSTTAAFALAAIGPDAAEAVPDLREALKSTDDGRRGRAAFALGEIGPHAKASVPELNQLLAKENEKLGIRLQAARALWAIAKQTEKILPILNKALDDEDAELNLQAAESVAKIAEELTGAKLKKPLPAELKAGLQEHTVASLIKLLTSDGSDNVRTASASALGALGVEARAAVPDLLEMLENEDADLRAVAAEALGKIGAGETLADKKGVWAKAAYPALIFYSKRDSNDKVQRTARAALETIGPPVADDAGLFIAFLKDKRKSFFFRNAAGQVLAEIGPNMKKEDVPQLGAILQDGAEDLSIRVLVIFALGEVGAEAKHQSAGLLNALKDADPGLNAAAAYALGEVFQKQNVTTAEDMKATKEVRAALTEATLSMDENVAAAARAALKKVP